MFKKFLTCCSLLLCISVLTLSQFESTSFIAENLETKDAEVKLEGEKEEMIASLHLLELNQCQFLYSTTKYHDHILVDYVVYLKIEDKPPRFFS